MNETSDRVAKCWICGGDAPIDEDYLPVSLHRCSQCGFVFAPDRSTGELHELYSDEYFDDFHGEGSYLDESQRRYEAKRRIDWVTQHVQSGRLLEIGAAHGVFLDEARRRGFEVTGVEPAPSYADLAREHFDIDVRAGFVENVELPPEPFDVVCAWHVLEHIPDPLPALRRLRSALASDGWMFIEIPNIESPRARQQKAEWIHLDPANHVAFYNPQQLSAVLEKAGFELTDHHTVTPISYYRPRLALMPGPLAMRIRDTIVTRSLQGAPHPSKHEFIRAIARPLGGQY